MRDPRPPGGGRVQEPGDAGGLWADSARDGDVSPAHSGRDTGFCPRCAGLGGAV